MISTWIYVCDHRSTAASLSIIRLVRTVWLAAGSCRCRVPTTGWILRLIGSCCALFDVSPIVSFFLGTLVFTPPVSGLMGGWTGPRLFLPLISLSFLTTTWFNWHFVLHSWRTGLKSHLLTTQGPFNGFKFTRFWLD